jgi:enoyl-CoA hydratase/carnithine racemase
MERTQVVIYEKKDSAAWLTINRPEKRNSLNMEVVDSLLEHMSEIEQDDEIRAVVITGAGDKAFCAGADLTGMGSGSSPTDLPDKIGLLLKRMALFPKPTIARVNGDCMAGGMGIMLACDMAYAKHGARLATPEVKVGLFPMMIGALIFRNVSRKKALEMIYTGRHYSAAEAEAMGLVTRACTADELEEVLSQTLGHIAGNGPLAIKTGRQTLHKVEYMDLDPAIDYLCFQLAHLIKSEDAAEGMQAFIEKRKPNWKGR